MALFVLNSERKGGQQVLSIGSTTRVWSLGINIFTSAEWYRVILDEAHIIKDRNTQTAKACFALNSERRWLLTGTPIQNSLDDFFSFVHFLKVLL